MVIREREEATFTSYERTNVEIGKGDIEMKY